MSTVKNVLTTGIAIPVLLPLVPVVALAWVFSLLSSTQTVVVAPLAVQS
jgi:hypothetical protein